MDSINLQAQGPFFAYHSGSSSRLGAAGEEAEVPVEIAQRFGGEPIARQGDDQQSSGEMQEGALRFGAEAGAQRRVPATALHVLEPAMESDETLSSNA